MTSDDNCYASSRTQGVVIIIIINANDWVLRIVQVVQDSVLYRSRRFRDAETARAHRIRARGGCIVIQFIMSKGLCLNVF